MIVLMGYKIIECKPIHSKTTKQTKSFSSKNLSKNEKKLVDSLVDPTFVILNANQILKKKLEKFLDAETRENLYMIDRSSKKLIESINKLRNNTNFDSD